MSDAAAEQLIYSIEDIPRTNGAGSPIYDVGVTGLAVLALLADGNTMRSGPHATAVTKGVRWLCDQQKPTKRRRKPKGVFGPAAAHDYIYDHAIATQAVIEAYGLSGREESLRKSAQAGLDYLAATRCTSATRSR